MLAVTDLLIVTDTVNAASRFTNALEHVELEMPSVILCTGARNIENEKKNISSGALES